ncbi:hypothetical protein Tco_1450013 [Tanacetum coccineum]
MHRIVDHGCEVDAILAELHFLVYKDTQKLHVAPSHNKVCMLVVVMIRVCDLLVVVMIWYVLHNSPKIDTYMAEFERQFPNSDMKQEFPCWFEPHIRQLYIDKDLICTDELFAWACRPSPTPISVNSYVVNSVRFVVHSYDELRTTQNYGICSPGENDEEMYYGQLEEILEFAHISLMTSNNDYFIASFIPLIMEYLVKVSKRRAFWSLNEDILKITILKTNTPYPSRKIRRIRACTHQRPQRKEDQYAVSRRSQYAVLKI